MGPLAAAELEGWARQPDGLAQLAAFEKKFPRSINVSNAREEFEFSGDKSIFMNAAGLSGATSGWQQRGTWTVL